MLFRSILGLIFATSLTQAAEGTPPAPTAAQLEFFEKEIRPVLADNCFKCHGPKKQKSGLRLDSRELILKGGEVGPVVVAGKPETSRLILAINHTKAKDVEPMPSADEKIPDKAIAALTEWVRMGLPWPAEASPLANDPRNHWAFQPVKPPTAPVVKAAKRVRQPLDPFVLAKLEANGLALAPDAPREVLARRLSLALVGYNPSEAEVAAYVADKDPAATEKLVDRLMGETAFGERWARHWLDVARYSDTKGYVFVEERRYPYAYTYRDWVVKAFNQDMPYDQFLRLQIAADKIVQGEDNRDLAAMGFLTLGRRFLNSVPEIIDDRIDVVMRGTQGLTMACARCHDHKFDPIPTAEYYSLYSIFNSSEEPKNPPALKPFARTKETDEFEAELAVRQKKHDDFVASRRENSFTAAKTADYLTLLLRAVKEPGFNFTQEAKRTNLYPAVLTGWQRVLKVHLKPEDETWGAWYQLKDVSDDQFTARLNALLAKTEAFKDTLLRTEIQKKTPKKFTELTACYANLLAEAHKPDNSKAEYKPWRDLTENPNGPTAITAASLIPGYSVADRNTRSKLEIEVVSYMATNPKSPPHAMVMNDKAKPIQGFIFLRGSANRPGKNVARQFLAILSDGKPQEFKNGSGRLEFADAIASKANPLTARVMVNRVWAELIGQPLVETPSDFGVRTAPPKNPELLDYLASTFMAQNWSMKKLIRSIVLSSTFQQSSDFNADAFAKDPENNLNWKANRRRLDFEAMRDSMLRVAGRLDATKIGGQPFDLVADFSTPRRTIYGFIDRQNLPPFFRTFDFANPDYHVPKRNQTTTPQQALWMLNHPFARTASDALAAKAMTQPNDEAKVRTLYAAVLARAPKPAEIKMALAYIHDAEETPVPTHWENGVGGWNPETKQLKFTPMTFRNKERISPKEQMPNAEFGHASLTRTGGHPGDTWDTAVIRRWSSGGGGRFRVESTLEVASKASDGVRGRIVSNLHGVLKEAVVAGGSSALLALKEIVLTPGETLDFIADNYIGSNSDSFKWSPVIKDFKTLEIIGSATAEFNNKFDPQSSWSALAQILIESNEFIFAD